MLPLDSLVCSLASEAQRVSPQRLQKVDKAVFIATALGKCKAAQTFQRQQLAPHQCGEYPRLPLLDSTPLCITNCMRFKNKYNFLLAIYKNFLLANLSTKLVRYFSI